MRWTQETYLLSPKLISKLKCAFNSYGGRLAEFEDFYHDYIIHILEAKGKHQTIDQYAIDWYRFRVGRFGNKKKLAYAINDDDYLSRLEAEKSHLSFGYIEHVKELLKKYRGRSRAIVMLYYVYSYDQEEIGLLFDISASRISQILKQIKSGENFEDKGEAIENIELQKENSRLREKLAKVFREKVLST